MSGIFQQSEATAAQRRVPVYLVDATDGLSPETGEAAGQPQISKNGGAFANTSATLTAIGNGAYYVILTATELNTLGFGMVRYKSAATAEFNWVFQVVPYDPYDSVRLGLTAMPNAAADAAGGLPISDAGGLDLDNRMPAAGTITNLDTLYDGVEGFGSAYAGPRGPGAYLNDAAGNTNTVNGVDGTWSNPVSTIAAAKTIADSLSVDRIYLVNDSVITLAATMGDYEFIGIGEMSANTIDLGSQDVDNSHFENVLISGAQGGTGRIQAKDCVLSVITGMEITALRCLLANAGSLTLRNDCAFDSCFSAVAGATTPTLNINSVANVNVYFRHYSGGMTIDNAVATTVISYEADGQLIIDATCTSLTIVVRGMVSPITDNGTTSTITQEGAYNEVEIAKAVWDRILTGATHNIATSAGRRLRGIQEFQGYDMGSIWIDTVNGTAGTTDFENGTVENPVDSIADANTLAASLNINKFQVAPGSTITLAAAQTGQVFTGLGWTLALGGQDISSSSFIGAAVSGIGTNTTGIARFIDCHINAITIPTDTHLLECHLASTITLQEAGDYFLDRCWSMVAGTSTPVIDFGAGLGASNVSVRHYSGGIEIQNMGAGAGSYDMSLEGHGQLVINANCSATSAVAIRGNFTVTDNAGGAVTLSDDARIDVVQINDEVVDVLKTDTITLPGQVAPPLAPTFEEAVAWLYKVFRNRKTQTATDWKLMADNESTVDAKATISDAAGTAIKQEIVSGP